MPIEQSQEKIDSAARVEADPTPEQPSGERAEVDNMALEAELEKRRDAQIAADAERIKDIRDSLDRAEELTDYQEENKGRLSPSEAVFYQSVATNEAGANYSDNPESTAFKVFSGGHAEFADKLLGQYKSEHAEGSSDELLKVNVQRLGRARERGKVGAFDTKEAEPLKTPVMGGIPLKNMSEFQELQSKYAMKEATEELNEQLKEIQEGGDPGAEKARNPISVKRLIRRGIRKLLPE